MTNTHTMRAVVLEEIGPPENLKIKEVPIPQVGDDDVLIRVSLAGLIYADAEARRGTYYSKTVLPWYPGREVAGTVEKVGQRVKGFKPGERVAAIVLGGKCQAEYVLASLAPYKGTAVPSSDIHHLPDRVEYGQALVYLINFRLAHMLFHGWARVPRGANILVHGAAGGMGSMITQLARDHGCRVFVTCRNDQEADYCRTNGADEVIDIDRDDYVAEIKRRNSGKGVGFVFNGVGGPTVNRDPKVVQPFGEIHLYGYVAGKPPFQVFDVDHTLALKTFNADNFFATPLFSVATRAMHEWFASKPLLGPGHVFSLQEVATAHRWLDEGRVVGKLVLEP